jgi:hypothetical protein
VAAKPAEIGSVDSLALLTKQPKSKAQAADSDEAWRLSVFDYSSLQAS